MGTQDQQEWVHSSTNGQRTSILLLHSWRISSQSVKSWMKINENDNRIKPMQECLGWIELNVVHTLWRHPVIADVPCSAYSYSRLQLLDSAEWLQVASRDLIPQVPLNPVFMETKWWRHTSSVKSTALTFPSSCSFLAHRLNTFLWTFSLCIRKEA
jgi:hypothetical protein